MVYNETNHAWVDVDAWSNGNVLILFGKGNYQNTNRTGGFKQSVSGSHEIKDRKLYVYNADGSSWWSLGMAQTVNRIDLTPYNKLKIHIAEIYTQYDRPEVYWGVSIDQPGIQNSGGLKCTAFSCTTSPGEYELDISSIDSPAYCFVARSYFGDNYVSFYTIWLEK